MMIKNNLMNSIINLMDKFNKINNQMRIKAKK